MRKNDIRGGTREWSKNLWDHIKALFSGLDTRVTALEQGGGGGGGAVSGVKGDAESSYRTGNVNLTPDNLGAVSKAGDTMSGSLIITKNDTSGAISVTVKNTSLGLQETFIINPDGNHGIWSNGYYNGTQFVDSGMWMIKRENSGKVSFYGDMPVNTGVFGVSSYTSVHAVGANYLIKFNNIVFGMLNMTFGTVSGNQIKIPLNTAFASVPVSFRPNSTITVPAMMQYNAGSWAAYEVTIGSDGNIKQNWSSSMTGIYLSVVYSIA